MFFLVSIPNHGQMQFGLGLIQDNEVFIPNFIQLDPDGDIFIRTTQDDLRPALFMNYALDGESKLNFSFDLIYTKKYQSMFIIKRDLNFINIHKRSHIAAGNIQFLANAETNINLNTRHFLSKIKLIIGVGPSLYFISSKPIRVYFVDTPELGEPFYQSQKIHRNLALIYNLRVSYQISNRIGLSLIRQGNITSVNHPMKLNGETFDLKTRWRNLGLLLTYTFNTF